MTTFQLFFFKHLFFPLSSLPSLSQIYRHFVSFSSEVDFPDWDTEGQGRTRFSQSYTVLSGSATACVPVMEGCVLSLCLVLIYWRAALTGTLRCQEPYTPRSIIGETEPGGAEGTFL